MTEKHITKTAEVRGIDPHEDAEILLFEAPFNGLIANVAFTPSEDVRGAYYTRELQLYSKLKAGGGHLVSSIQLSGDDIWLPSGERHHAQLLFPPASLRVREGDAQSWSSIGSVGEGPAVPAGTVEVVFERKQIDEDLAPPELWAACVPNYWIGKQVLVKHESSHTPAPGGPTGATQAYYWEHIGTVHSADSESFNVVAEPLEHGRLPRNVGYRWQEVRQVKLVEDA
jgi:hypothetical protein